MKLVDPVAEHEERAGPVAALVGVVEVADHHRVVSVGEARRGDLAPQAVGVERTLLPRVARPARDPVGERNAEVGMEQPVEPDAERIADHLLEHAIAEVAAHQAVAVVEPDPAPLVLERSPRRRRVRSADLLAQEGPEPEVVVAVEVDDRDAGLEHATQHAEGGEVAARDRGAVLEPEVEQVADDVEDRGAARQRGQECREGALARAPRVPADSAPRCASDMK